MSSIEILSAKRIIDGFVLQFEYTNDERMKYFKQKIDENVGPEDYKTNVKGKMTDYHFFQKDSTFMDFIYKEFFIFEINKYLNMWLPLSTPNLKGLQGNVRIVDAWGSKLEKGGEVIPHTHPAQWSSILYFCDSAPLETEVGKFPTFKGKIITISGWLNHWVPPINCEERYNIVWNWNYDLSLQNQEELKK